MRETGNMEAHGVGNLPGVAPLMRGFESRRFQNLEEVNDVENGNET